jgi:glycosyltransferase involved in cell wall biosynthesis
LDESKGPDLLVKAFRQLPDHPPATLSIYGPIPQNEYGSRLLSIAGDDERIRFCGGYAHEDSARIYENLDILVIPSLWYDFPLVAHEALATGTVVVATDIPGLNEIVTNGISGLLFKRNSIDELQAKLWQLLTSSEIVDRLSSNLRPVKGVGVAVEEMVRVYSQCI